MVLGHRLETHDRHSVYGVYVHILRNWALMVQRQSHILLRTAYFRLEFCISFVLGGLVFESRMNNSN